MLEEYMKKRGFHSVEEVREHIKYNCPQRPMELFDELNESAYKLTMGVDNFKSSANVEPTLQRYHDVKNYGDDWELCLFDYCCLDGCGTRAISQLSEATQAECKAQGYVIDSDIQHQLYTCGEIHISNTADMEIIRNNFLKPAREVFSYNKQYTKLLMLGKMMQECCGELYQILQQFDAATKEIISCSNNNEREYLKRKYNLDDKEFAYKVSKVLVKVKEHVDSELLKSKDAQLEASLASMGYPDKDSVRRKLLCDINGISIDRDVLFDYLNETDYNKIVTTRSKPADVNKYIRTNGFEKPEDAIFTFCCLDVYNKTAFNKLSERSQKELIDHEITTDDDIRNVLATPKGFIGDKLPISAYADVKLIEGEFCRTDYIDLSQYPADVGKNMFPYLIKEMRRHNLSLLIDCLTPEYNRAIYWRDLFADLDVVSHSTGVPLNEIIDLRNNFVACVCKKCNVVLPETKSSAETTEFGFSDKDDMRQFLLCDINGLPVSRDKLWEKLNQTPMSAPKTFKELSEFTDSDKAFDVYAKVNGVYESGRVQDAVFTYCCLDNRNRTLLNKLSPETQEFLKSKGIMVDDQIRAQLLQSTNLYAAIQISMKDRDIIKHELNKGYVDLLYYDQSLTRDMDEKCFVPLLKEMSRNNVDAMRRSQIEDAEKAYISSDLDADIEQVAKENNVSVDYVVAVRKKFVERLILRNIILVDENEYDNIEDRVVAAHSMRAAAEKALRGIKYGR